jgi:hypothetical protein
VSGLNIGAEYIVQIRIQVRINTAEMLAQPLKDESFNNFLILRLKISDLNFQYLSLVILNQR